MVNRIAGIIFNTRDINTVIAKNCIIYRADTHSVSMQFCGNLPLCLPQKCGAQSADFI